jgi:hypothetical protein
MIISVASAASRHLGGIAMSPSAEHASQATSGVVPDLVIAAWSELKSYLDRRSKELSEEVRNYPTPIARCDEQLTKLIEQRARAINQLKLLIEAGATQSNDAERRWLVLALGEFLMSPQAITDDEIEIALRSRLRAALSGLRDKM